MVWGSVVQRDAAVESPHNCGLGRATEISHVQAVMPCKPQVPSVPGYLSPPQTPFTKRGPSRTPSQSPEMAASLTAAKQQLRSLVKQRLSGVSQDSVLAQSTAAGECHLLRRSRCSPAQ